MTLCWCTSCGRGSCSYDASGVCVSVEPAAGSGAHQVFEVRLEDNRGLDRLGIVRILVNGIREGARACYIYYVLPGTPHLPPNAFLLVDDTGLKSTALETGMAGSVRNGQCRLDGAGSAVSLATHRLKIHLNLTFDPGFHGEKQIFVAYDDRMGTQSELQSRGSWWVP